MIYGQNNFTLNFNTVTVNKFLVYRPISYTVGPASKEQLSWLCFFGKF